MSIRILLVDDHKIMREGLHSMLEKQYDMKIVGEAEDGRTAVRLVQELTPDVVIMDVMMPGLNGIEATRQIIATADGIKVIGLSMHSDKRFVTRMLNAGASGYLLKDCAFEELADAVHTVVANEIYLSSEMTSIMVKDYLHHLSTTGPPSSSALTTREDEVLQLLAEGKSTKEIALCLNVSTKTIETHRRQIMEKLNIHTIAGLTKYAIREGLSSLES